MRKIEELINEYRGNYRLWFVLEDEEDFRAFAEEVNELGIHFVNDSTGEPVKEEDLSDKMAITDGKLAYVSAMVFCYARQTNMYDGSIPVRIRYGNYRNGKEDYLIETGD